MSTQKNQSRKKYAHLSKLSSVVSTKSTRGLLGLFALLIVLAIIFILMLSGRHDALTKGPAKVNRPTDEMLAENTRRLHTLEMLSQKQSAHKHASIDRRKQLARQNAPTKMYQAMPSKQALPVHDKVLSGQGKFAHYANQQSSQASIAVQGTRLHHPNQTIVEGELIHAVLETAINSELPGMVRAIISRPVYSYLGNHILIPAGSRIIGQYSDMLNNGSASTRLFVIWNRIITPAGLSMMINSPGVDALGRAGQGADSIAHHFMRVFGSAVLLSILGAGAANYGVSASDQPNSANGYRQAIAQAFQQSSHSLLGKNMSIKPTLHMYQGDSINIFVAHDIDLSSVLNQA